MAVHDLGSHVSTLAIDRNLSKQYGGCEDEVKSWAHLSTFDKSY